jgi:hypothetical protein
MSVVRGQVIAVLDGGDWTDASVKHLVALKNYDPDDWKTDYDIWYQKTYIPLRRIMTRDGSRKPKYWTFVEWLLAFGHAREATKDEVYEMDMCP